MSGFEEVKRRKAAPGKMGGIDGEILSRKCNCARRPRRRACTQLGATLAFLDRKDEAIREGRRATELLPETKDAFEGPRVTIVLAQIYAWTGETDQALQLIEHSLQTPAGITVPLLRLDLSWDRLRSDPRFEALLEKYGAKG